ncbi:MAG: M14 family zinc carboxypeptidase [Mangrovibacterium sp.]
MKQIMSFRLYIILLLLSAFQNPLKAEKISYYYDKEIRFNPQIPSPEQFLGYETGTRITEHSQINAYFEKLDELSDRATLVEIGKTNEGRKIRILIVSAAENLKKLDQIRQEREKVRSGEKPDPAPLIIFLGYGVHGNEASGPEAALLSAYYLVAAENEKVQKELQEGVYLIDPLRNPDGHERFAAWVNSNVSINLTNDSPYDREHTEGWPNGRGNHYWFDLNRDWVNLVNPESKARVAFYQSWLPHVQVDHHEMGANSTFFFEPTNPDGNESPYVPRLTYQINKLFADYYAQALNKIGSFYYTKEGYDNKNPTFGSTYPDYNGGVGILFEQGSSRGIIQQTDNGPLTFAHTIRNQLTASLATIDAAFGNKDQLFQLQEQYFTAYKTDKDAAKSYLVGDPYDITRLQKFVRLLLAHRLEVYENAGDVTLNGVKYEKGKSYIVPVKQPNSALVRIIFDSKKDYTDPSALGYGSGFSVAYSSGLSIAETLQAGRGPRVETLPVRSVVPLQKSAYAYLIDYRDSKAAQSLFGILSKDILVKTSFKPFTATTAKGAQEFSYGTLLIPVQGQKIGSEELFLALKEISDKDQVEIVPVETGLSLKGVDLGSSNFRKITKPEVLVLTGSGLSSTEAGEVWHFFDQKIQYPLVRAELGNLRRIDLYQFNRIVLVSGDYSKPVAEQLKEWVQNGGTLITINGASRWAIENKIASEKIIAEKADSSKTPQRIPFDQALSTESARRIPSSIFETSVDLTHPLGFGLTSSRLPVIRESATFYRPSKSPYLTVSVYTENPLLNGYISDENLLKIKQSASLLVSSPGSGRVVLFAEDPLFRGIWDGTTRIFLNAIVLGDNLSAPGNFRY